MHGIFSDIYLNNFWEDPESVSGRGSTLARTEVIRQTLPSLLKSIGAKSLLDAPCGDFNWMQRVDLTEVDYVGADVVTKLIARNQQTYTENGRRFVALDITTDKLPNVDVIMCRDCFIHLSFRSIHAAIANFKRSNSKFLLATTHVNVREHVNIRDGEGRQVNLQLTPFNLPEPVELIVEDSDVGKCLGLWKLDEL
jgi:2-polyprenyl-3-methyl-5-hydroxy-6-metoxy-1,4-benzoquinol methylase